MSSWIVLDRDYAELKLSDGRLHHLREEMLKIAQQWDISSESCVIKFIKNFHGSTYLEIVDELVIKEDIELFGKLFLAAVKKADLEGYYDYFEIPDDSVLSSFYYNVFYKCLEPVECCGDCIAKVNQELFIKETGGIFKQGTRSTEFYEFANKILEYAAKLED